MITALSLMIAAQMPALPEPRREFRGAWVATVDNIDWPSKRGIAPNRAKAELRAIMDKAAELNLNCIVFQIRPHADALYDSQIEPWSEYLTGQQGRPPQPYWDPLEYAVDEAHKRGIELHVWFNPYRAWHPSAKGAKADSYVGRTHPEAVKKYGVYEWMDPSEPFTQKRTLDVMIDVVKRYDIDGVHIDDYFYPYPVSESGQKVDFPDSPSWDRYVQSGGKLTRDDWRRKSVDDFIENMYKSVKEAKPWVKVGISPFGIYRPGVPEGIKAGVDQYADLYADARKWLKEGWCDYYTPQLYWPIKQTPQAFPVLLEWWLTQNPKNRHLWPGLYTSRTNPGDGNWNAKEVVDQIGLTRTTKANGTVHFSFKALQRNWNDVGTALKEGPYMNQALVPASPWLSTAIAKGAVDGKVEDGGSHFRLSWTAGEEATRFYAIYGLQGDRWVWWDTTSEPTISVAKLKVEGKVSHVAVRAVDRVGNIADPLIIQLTLE